jgi:RHH-type proline utilization regulon transcriptional repressor/proline dehydrogenase/delta 1-pyrroline-5-carboxylate dehydrogenase
VLLGYLVRRILENGANSSFVHRLFDRTIPIEELTRDPVEELQSCAEMRHPLIRRAPDLYKPERRNSQGLDLTDPFITRPLLAEIEKFKNYPYPKIDNADPGDLELAMRAAQNTFPAWSQTDVEKRAKCLEKLGELIEHNRAELMAILVREGFKTLPDALAEVREAIDYCRYYAMRAREDFRVYDLPGPTGECNQIRLVGRGVFGCISPWNFPLAIFLGQALAALVAGNCVIAKPAPQTPLIATRIKHLIYEAGIPADAFHVIAGGPKVGADLVNLPELAGVAFTGSTATARAINQALAQKEGPIVPLIAETGGQNAMIADSSALPEQVVDDVITSAFRSAGQRCSALRVLYLPETTAGKILTMLAGAMRELRVGDPGLLDTDVGPAIDEDAQKKLLAHVERLRSEAREVCTIDINATLNRHPDESRDPAASVREQESLWAHGRAPLDSGLRRNDDWFFVAPQAWEIPSIGWLEGEVFGPILHVIRYAAGDLGRVINEINSTGFGLTFCLHSRIEHVARRVERELHVGNCYINRSTIGAIVGVQPFGGEGLSGTGPKAGGPHYLPRFALERVTSNNLMAAGGNASLFIAVSK